MLTRPPDFSWLIRGEDKFGAGHFGASRTRDGIVHLHMGVDLLHAPGTKLYIWEPLYAVRIAVPYADDDRLLGILLRRPDTADGVEEFKFLYVEPALGVIGKHLNLGDHFATVQDLGRRYYGISNHAHFEHWRSGTRVDPTSLVRDFSQVQVAAEG